MTDKPVTTIPHTVKCTNPDGCFCMSEPRNMRYAAMCKHVAPADPEEASTDAH